ncbi:uncharacterized protein LOC132548955 [Ylistrum balloti]|uniref:uncharacterized protein LOC132548955 n=1 Tax=Ylistrum balloti TaxID=509963 RepID=UPI0029058CA4|nr:uncharacterized protein LOC132548955 [Ylistrum balloti]
MAEVQVEVASRAPSTSTRCNAQSPTTRTWRKGSPKCDSVQSALPNFSPINSRPSSSNTEQDSLRYQFSSLNSSFSERDVCRICHGGNSSELLLSPCYCAGSMGKIHLSCLQRWLGSSNKTRCEICDFQFTLERKTKPFKQFLANPGSPRDKKNLICDMVCFSILMPLTITTAWLCMTNAIHLNLHMWESAGLFSLAMCLIIIFFFWAAICFRHNFNMWKDWRQFNQDVKLKCQPPLNVLGSQADHPSGIRGHSHLTTVEIPINRRQLLPNCDKSLQSVGYTCGKDTHTAFSPTQSNHSKGPKGVKDERLRNHVSPRSGYNSRSFQDSAFQNLAVKQDLFPNSRNPATSQRSISPVCHNLTAGNDPKCKINEQKRFKCSSPRPQHITGQSEQIPRTNSNTYSGKGSRSPSLGLHSSDRSFHQEITQNQINAMRSSNHVLNQESSDQMSSTRSVASSGGSSVVYTLPSVTDSSSRSIEYIHQDQIPRSINNHPREQSVTRGPTTRELSGTRGPTTRELSGTRGPTTRELSGTRGPTTRELSGTRGPTTRELSGTRGPTTRELSGTRGPTTRELSGTRGPTTRELSATTSQQREIMQTDCYNHNQSRHASIDVHQTYV